MSKIKCNSKCKSRFRMKKWARFLPCLIFFFVAIACNSDNKDNVNPYDKPHRPNEPVLVNGMGPTSGGLGTRVVVTGENFGNDKSKVSLFFNEKKALIITMQDNAIYALVPRQPGEFSTVKVVVGEKEYILEDVKFQYFISEIVSTVAGVQGPNGRAPVDGPAFQAVFTRIAKSGVDSDGNVIILDDSGNRVRLYSPKEQQVITLFTGGGRPWCCGWNPQRTEFYIGERGVARPTLGYILKDGTNYAETYEIIVDQRDAEGQWIYQNAVQLSGNEITPIAITSDETYIYIMSAFANVFVRIHQVTKKMELIGKQIGTIGEFFNMVYSPFDKKIYVCSFANGRIFRFDPYNTPPGYTTPWITFADWEHIAGTGSGVQQTLSKEGRGLEAQMGQIQDANFDEDGNLYFTDFTYHCIWKMDRYLNITMYTGPGAGAFRTPGYQDGGLKEARYSSPYGVAFSKDYSQLYICDNLNGLLRRVTIE